MRFRRFDGDLDDFVELKNPIPWTPDLLTELKGEMHRAWLNEQARASQPTEVTRPASMWGDDDE